MSDPFSTVDITDESGATVISIETLRDARRRRPEDGGKCQHRRVLLDPMEAWLTCRDCAEKVNPIAWVMRISEDWRHVQRDYKAMRAENARLDLRKWAICRCGQRILLMGRSEDEKRRRATREARLEEALETIALLTPEAAANGAARVAKKALAAVVTGSGEDT